MKHPMKITALLITFFFLAQLIGLVLVYQDIKVDRVVSSTGEVSVIVSHPETVLGERPDVKGFDSLIMVLISVLIGTGLILIVAKFGLSKIWKAFFFFAIFSAVTIALGTFLNVYLAAGIGFLLALMKIFKPNIITHNISEVLIYAGIAILFVPLFDPLWIFVLLVIISFYDMFAVWKSKHMIKLAEFQMESHAFAGIFVSSGKMGKQKPGGSKGKSHVAVVGGGDIAFPLLFAGTVMEFFISSGLGNFDALLRSVLIAAFATIALAGLMFYGKKGRYYPAMPFITAGVVVGYLVTLLI